MHVISKSGDYSCETLKGVKTKMAKKTNNKSRKPDNTEKIPFPHDSDKIGKNVSKDRV